MKYYYAMNACQPTIINIIPLKYIKDYQSSNNRFLNVINKKFVLSWIGVCSQKLIDVFKFKDNFKKDSEGLHMEGDSESTNSFWHIFYAS